MCLQGHLCYRGHLSLSVLLSINLGLEGNWHVCCLTFHGACLVSASGVVGGGCPMDMSLGRSIVTTPMSGRPWHPQRKPTAKWQLSVLCAVASWLWCRWLPSQLVSLWPREEGCTRKRRELRSRFLAVGPPLMCCLYLSTSSSSSFNINELSSCQCATHCFQYAT